MSASPEKPDDAERTVRASLGEWAAGIEGHPVPDFAQKIAIVSLQDKTVYAGFLRCLFDARTAPAPKLLEYRESAPPKTADKKNPWALASGLNKQYLEQEATIVAAEPGEPQACNRCGDEHQLGVCEKCRGEKTAPCEACVAHGRKSCAACGGRGSIVCAQCAGRGKVLQSMTADGMRNEDDCPQCTGKKELPCPDCSDAAAPDCAACGNKRVVSCSVCEGRGVPVCPQCGGARRVIQGFAVTISYKLSYFRSLVRDRSIPESVFPEDPAWGKLGETVLECESEDAASLAAKKPDGPAGDAFAKVLAQGAPPSNSRLIMQALSIERIPVYDVAYTFEGKEYRAWVSRFENRLVPLGDPFADRAVRWADEAESFLEKNDFASFEERAARAAALAPRNPAVAALRAKAGAVQRRAALVFGAKAAGGLAVAIPVLLAFAYKSPNRFLPLAALALAVAGAALAGVFRLASALASRPLLPPRRRNALAGAAATGGALLAVGLFLALGPIRRIDTGEFAVKESRFDSLAFADWGPADDAELLGLVKDYAARGVDVSAGQDLLDRRAGFLAIVRAQALAEEKAREAAAFAARAKAEAAARQKALAAQRLAAKKAAAAKAKAKKKKKKRP